MSQINSYAESNKNKLYSKNPNLTLPHVRRRTARIRDVADIFLRPATSN
jgi:hypothetical protein